MTQDVTTKIFISLSYLTFILLYLALIVDRGPVFVELLSLTGTLENENLSVWMKKKQSQLENIYIYTIHTNSQAFSVLYFLHSSTCSREFSCKKAVHFKLFNFAQCLVVLCCLHGILMSSSANRVFLSS